MKPKQMLDIGHAGTHACAPKAWREVPVLSGDYDTDATLMARKNSDLPARLALHIRQPRSAGPGTGYNGYRGYSKDN